MDHTIREEWVRQRSQERVERMRERALQAQERALQAQERAIQMQERALQRSQQVRERMQMRTHERDIRRTEQSWSDESMTQLREYLARGEDELPPAEEAPINAPPAPTLVFPKNIEISDECSICLETDSRLVLGCRHTVCVPCIQKIKTCPICRHEIQLDLVKSV